MNRSFSVYTGKNTVINSPLFSSETHKTAAIVLKLLEALVGKGFTLWRDNYYNSPDLALHLKLKHSTDCVGTMKITRKNIPKEVKDAKLKKRRNYCYAIWSYHYSNGMTKPMLPRYQHTTMLKLKQ